jgi:shikimate dehydrogenase
MTKNKKFGLIGKNISYSFSKKYFTEKFKNLELNNYTYENFDLRAIEDFPAMYKDLRGQIQGFNVTIPYKQDIIKYLDEIDEDANTIGAVNTIKIMKEGKLKGYNTDIYGFENSLRPLLQSHIKKALILGTGGASKAIAFVLKKNDIYCNFVSRNPTNTQTISYDDLDVRVISNHHLIINCTPVGTFPNIESSPGIPYEFLGDKHFLYDLVYNPEVSTFLAKGEERGAKIKNGEEMLQLQADRSWEIWNS